MLVSGEHHHPATVTFLFATVLLVAHFTLNLFLPFVHFIASSSSIPSSAIDRRMQNVYN